MAYDVGEWVYLKIQPYDQQFLTKKRCENLSPKFFGPYQILGRVGEVGYRLDLPITAKINLVFHVSQLKKAVRDKHQVQLDILLLND